LLFNLLSYTDETTNIQKSNIDDIVTELSDILLTSTKQWYNADCKKAKQNFRKAKDSRNITVHTYLNRD
jgi:hypothetical protein